MKFTLRDYNYVKNRYFFVSNYYRNRFEASYSEDLRDFINSQDKEIVELDVFISTSSTNDDAIEGAAVLDPTDPDWQNYSKYTDIETETGKTEVGFFRYLWSYKYSCYSYDSYRGFFWLKLEVPYDQTIAVMYTLRDGTQVGSFNDSTFSVLLKLIRPRNQVPTETYKETWPLHMNNVYAFSPAAEVFDDYNIEIRHRNKVTTEDTTKTSYCNRLGIDILNAKGDFKADGRLDNNPLLFNLHTGILIFPGLHPFDPLPESRFQLLDIDRVKFYNTTIRSNIEMQSKFDLTLKIRD